MRGNGGNKGQGSKWCTRAKRLAIYLRDGLMCVYCDRGVDDGKVLTLDHLVPRSKRGTNRSTNLVTACIGCNAGRRDRKWWAGLLPERRALIERLRNREPQHQWATDLLTDQASVHQACRREARGLS